MGQHALSKVLNVFGGKDARSTDVKREPIFCRDSVNMELSSRNACTTRPGTKGVSKAAGGGGCENYLRTDPSTGAILEEIVTIDANLHKKVTGTLTVAYVGAFAVHSLSVTPTLNTDGTYSFHCVLLNGTTTDLDQDLGKGIDESSLYTINQLISAIDALTDWTCSLTTGVGTGPAAFLPNLDNLLIEAAGTLISFSYWSQIPCPVTNPFSAFWAGVNTANFENASLQNCDDQLFVATGQNELYVYDSHAVFRAGMPSATALQAAVGAATGLTGTYEYMMTYEFDNAVERVIEGDESNRVTAVPANQKIDVTFPFIKPAAGWYAHSAVIAGGSSPGTSITVTAGHNLVAGDTVMITNPTTHQAQWVKVVTAGATTIVIDTSTAFSTSSPLNIMSTISINLWRNASGDTELKYLRGSYGNDGHTAGTTNALTDSLADATLIGYATYDPPVKMHSLPPANLKYLTVFNTLLCGVTGVDDEVWFSDWDGPQYFPEDSSSFTIRSKTAARPSGISATRELLCITKGSETHLATGDLPNGQFRQERIADAIGCDSHATMVSIDNVLCFWSKTFGVRRVFSSGILADWSYRILPEWTDPKGSTSEEIVPRRALALTDSNRQRVLLYIPCEDAYAHNSYSRLYIVDYRDAGKSGSDGEPMVRYFPCKNINAQGGMCIHQGVPYFMERRLGVVTGVMEYNLCQFLYNNTEDDFSDHAQPMECIFDGPWYYLDEPSILKLWLVAKLYNQQGGITSDADFTLEIEQDGKNGVAYSKKTFSADTSSSYGWGYGPWGAFAWGALSRQKWILDLIPTVSEGVKPVVRNETLWCQQIAFDGIEFEVVPDYDVEIQK